MVKKFKVPFASGGNTNTVPDGAQVDGTVSYTTGFTSDYEKAYNEQDAKDVERMDMNGILKDITGAVGDLQTHGASTWTLDGAPHPKGALVWYQDSLYQSRKNNNTSTPSHGADWYEVDLQERNMPIGATYIQFPGQPEPVALWGGTWIELYANDSVFFRTGGSASNPFDGSIQQDDIKGHNHSATTASAGGHVHGASTDVAGSHDHGRGTMEIFGTFGGYNISAGTKTFGAFTSDGGTRTGPSRVDSYGEGQMTVTMDASRAWVGRTTREGAHKHEVAVDSAGAHIHPVTVNSTGGNETRPKNITIKIWLRTA